MSQTHPTVRPHNPTLKVQRSDRTIRDVAEAIGKEYIESDRLPGERDFDVMLEKYRKIAQVNAVLYDAIDVDVVHTPDDPYDSADEMFRDIEENDRLKVFTGGTHPVFLTVEENIQGRAVHDYWGHYKNRVDFSFEGEFKKWDNHKYHYPEECWGILFAEVVGQLGAAYYLPDGFDSDRFCQRPVDAPQRWIDAARSVIE